MLREITTASSSPANPVSARMRLAPHRKRTKFRSIHAVKIRPPLTVFVRFDRTGPGDGQRTQLSKINGFVVDATNHA